MKLNTRSETVDTSIMRRLSYVIDKAAIRFGFKNKPVPTARECYETAIKSSTITPEQRRRAHENAAASSDILETLDGADAAYERHQKGPTSGELHGRAPARGSSGR